MGAVNFITEGAGKLFSKLRPVKSISGGIAKMSTFNKVAGGAAVGVGLFSTVKGVTTRAYDGVLDGLSMVAAAVSFIPGANIVAAVGQFTIAVPRFVGALAMGKGLKVASMKAGADAAFGAVEFIPGGGVARLVGGTVVAGGMSMAAAKVEENASRQKLATASAMNVAQTSSAAAATPDAETTKWRQSVTDRRNAAQAKASQPKTNTLA